MDPQNQNNPQIPPNNKDIPPIPQPEYPQAQPPVPQGQSYGSSVPPLGYQQDIPQPPKTNTMAIISLIMVFVFTPLALIFGLVALSQIKKTGENGRGLAIAGTILGALGVLFTILIISSLLLFLPEIQKEARDLERQTDISAIVVQLEAEYNETGSYPATLSESSLPELFPEALDDPGGGGYSYTALPEGCTTDCSGYELSTTLEDGSEYVRRSRL